MAKAKAIQARQPDPTDQTGLANLADQSPGVYYETFRARLKAWRENLGYSQERMARGLGMTKANYQKYEDRSKFPLHKLEALSIVVHLSIEFIVTGKNTRTGHKGERNAPNLYSLRK